MTTATVKQIAVIIFACGVILFLNLGKAHLWDRDEPRNAGCAAEMLAAGNWIVPIFNDELRQQKPVLLYWLIMSAYSVFGQNEFAARFWSAVSGCGTVLLTWSIGRHVRDAETGLLAALILVSSLMFCVAGRAATPDSALIFCVTAAMWLYVRGVLPSAGANGTWFPTSFRDVVSLYAMLGLAVLAKGPVGFLLPMMVMGLFMLIQRRTPFQQQGKLSWIKQVWACFQPVYFLRHFFRTLAAMRIVWGVAVVLLIAAPWFIAVGLQTDGAFNRLFFLRENFARATSVMESHAGEIWFYPVAIAAGFFPWSVFFVPVGIALAKTKVEPVESAGQRLMWIWIGMQVAVFSLASTKLPSYMTPCYPALAVLTALGLNHLRGNESVAGIVQGWLAAAMIVLAVSGVGVIVGIRMELGRHLPKLLLDSPWLPWVGLIPVIGAFVGLVFIRKNNVNRLVHVSVFVAVLFCVVLFGFGTVAVDRQQQFAVLAKYLRQQPTRTVASWRCLEPSWVYYAGRPIFELVTMEANAARLAVGESQDADGSKALLKRTGNWLPRSGLIVEQLVQLDPAAVIITTAEHVPELKNRLPADFEVLQTADQFLKQHQLVLLGRSLAMP